MVYEEFLSIVQSSLKSRLGDSISVTVQKVPKNNGTMMDGLSICRPGEHISPTIYLNSFYEHWKSGVSLAEILEEIQHIYADGTSFPNIDPGILNDFKKLRDRVAYRLVHTASNQEMLRDLPSVSFLDLSVIFYLYLEENEYGHMTATIHKSHAKSWGVTEIMLYQLAQRNTPRLLPAELKSMREVIEGLRLCQTDDALTKQTADEHGQEPAPLYVLGNTSGINGACAVLYDHVLKNFADPLEQDLIILPSSIHEVLLVPYTEELCINDLFHMVHHINRTEVPVEDRLSDEIYYYRRAEDRITLMPRLSKHHTS